MAEEDYSFVSVYAGVGAGLIRKEENAEYVVREVQQQLESSLAGSFQLPFSRSFPTLLVPLTPFPFLFLFQLVATRTGVDLMHGLICFFDSRERELM